MKNALRHFKAVTSHSFISIIHFGKFGFTGAEKMVCNQRRTEAGASHFFGLCTTILFKENDELSSAPLPVGAKGCFDHDAVDTARQAMTNALFPLYEEIMRLSPQLPTYNANGSSPSEVKRFRARLIKLVQSRQLLVFLLGNLSCTFCKY